MPVEEDEQMQRACAVGLALLLAGAIVSGPGAPGARAAGTRIIIPGDSYLPAAVMIGVGQTVTWVNEDTDPHVTTTVPGTPASFTLVHQPGKSTSFTFTKPGIYPCYCID